MKTNKLFTGIIIAFMGFYLPTSAQNLLEKLENEFPKTHQIEIATFKTTRIGLGHSIETRSKGALEIAMYNRYWNIPDFDGQRFLADKVSTRFSLEYSITDRFTFGGGYTNFDKITDGFLKYRLIRQLKGSRKAPMSITLLQTISHLNTNGTGLYPGATPLGEYGYSTQVLVARKFNPKFSAQISPTYIRRKAASSSNNPTDQFAIGFGGRHKVGGHVSIVSEYFYVMNPLKSIDTYNAFSVGVNWELSHLMLQFQVTNARNFADDTFITRTTNNFNFEDGNFHFGFNATFVLHTRKKKL
ncbi:MAG: hypothetical protein JXQ93_05685 [Flavobacteriaceae bacterium]